MSNQEDDLPSYSDVVNAEQLSRNNNVQTSIQDELQKLSIGFNIIRGQKLHLLQQNDEKALSLLIPHIKAFFAEYSETTLPIAALTLIPAGIIDPFAVPADDDLRSPDDFCRIIAVKPGGEAKDFWNGADMTERLASYLRSPVEYQPNSLAVDAVQSKKSFWRNKSVPGVIAPPFDNRKEDLPKVAMIVKAEELVFRTQSELGLYETQHV